MTMWWSWSIAGGCLAIAVMASACGGSSSRDSADRASGGGAAATATGGRSGSSGETGGSDGGQAGDGGGLTGGSGGGSGAPAGSGGSGGGSATGGTAGSAPGGGSGGSATGGAPSSTADMECAQATDCQLLRAPCGCVPYPVDGEPPSVPTACEVDWCAELGVTEEDVACLRGQCSLALECDPTVGTCEEPRPDCPNGEVPAMHEGCYGPCVPVAECVPDYWTLRDYSILEGVWLVGWPGGELHYSVLRFPPSIAQASAGEVEFLADPDLPANVPLLPCSGVGAFSINAMMGSFSLFYPPDCADGAMWDTSIYFEHFDVGYGEHGSTLHATVHIDGVAPDPVGGWWFPADECDVAMTHCGFEDTSTD